MPKFRKKPVVIDAMQFDGTIASASAICQWANAGAEEPLIDYVTQDGDDKNAHDMLVHTLEGDHTASPGDWIIRGVAGEFYPCKPAIFAATYEAADAPATSGAERIAAERRRQIEEEGWDANHDDNTHGDYALAAAGACYALYPDEVFSQPLGDGQPEPAWPWPDDDKRGIHPPLRRLEIAGALIAAEIDRMLRAESEEPG